MCKPGSDCQGLYLQVQTVRARTTVTVTCLYSTRAQVDSHLSEQSIGIWTLFACYCHNAVLRKQRVHKWIPQVRLET